MGLVYEAVQESTERRVAVKLMRPELAASAAQKRRFAYEAQILAELSHPNIAQVIEAGTHCPDGVVTDESDAGIPYLVMEYVPDARSITDFARDEGLSRRERLELFLKACSGVEHGHQKSILHRDLKPNNILVDPHAKVKVIDFGVARALDADIALTTMHTAVGQLVGTVQYMSPEQCEADPEKIDFTSDVYSLGVLLFELLCGRLPYDLQGAAIFEAAGIIIDRPPRKPSAIDAGLHGDLETIVLKALEKERSNRYGSVAAFADDVRRYLDGKPILARPAGALERIWKWARRNPVVSAAATLVLAALTGFLSYMLFFAYPQLKTERERILRAYAEITRLSDVTLLARLEKSEKILYPAHPRKLAGFESWIDSAEELAGRLVVHRRTLDRLRKKALTYDESIKQRDRESHPMWATYVHLKKQRVDIEKRMSDLQTRIEAEGKGGSKAQLQSMKEMKYDFDPMVTMIDELEADIFKRRLWVFDDPKIKWQHDILTALVEKLEAFVDPDKGLAGKVRERWIFARTVTKKSIDDHRDAWDSAIASIADETRFPCYGGLTIEPTIGLVPLGADPNSGLFEFAHLRTGTIPARDIDGRLQLSDLCGLVFVLIPGGKLKTAESEREHVLEPFFLSKYEMTQGQWLRIAGQNPSQMKAGQNRADQIISLLNPVEMVSWDDCAALLPRVDLRLPTAAEWEYAIRAGTTTTWWTGDVEKSIKRAANVRDKTCRSYDAYKNPCEDWEDGYAVHQPVGRLDPNPFGLHDVMGNVMEWCQDGVLPDKSLLDDDGTFGGSLNRVFRGGSWACWAENSRSSFQSSTSSSNRFFDYGVRPAASLPPTP